MQRAFPTGWTLTLLAALVLGSLSLPSRSFATTGDSDVPVTLEQCRDQLLSGEFGVFDLRKEARVMPGVARQFSRIIDEIIARKGTKDFEKSKDRFDRARGNLLERIIDGRWGMNETSDDILSDCFFAVHPEAETD